MNKEKIVQKHMTKNEEFRREIFNFMELTIQNILEGQDEPKPSLLLEAFDRCEEVVFADEEPKRVHLNSKLAKTVKAVIAEMEKVIE